MFEGIINQWHWIGGAFIVMVGWWGWSKGDHLNREILLQSLQPLLQFDGQDDQHSLFLILGVSGLFLHENGSLVMDEVG